MTEPALCCPSPSALCLSRLSFNLQPKPSTEWLLELNLSGTINITDKGLAFACEVNTAVAHLHLVLRLFLWEVKVPTRGI